MGWLDSFLHPERGYEKGQEQLDKFYNESKGMLAPYIEGGKKAFNPLFSAMQELLNPVDLENKWISSYEKSPYAKQLQDEARTQGADAASSLGLMGSTPALNAITTGSTNIMNADRQHFMDDLIQKYLAGTGIGQNIYGIGANSANTGATNAINMGNSSAELAYGKENAPGNAFSSLLGQGIGLVGSALGGPIGGALSKRWNLAGG